MPRNLFEDLFALPSSVLPRLTETKQRPTIERRGVTSGAKIDYAFVVNGQTLGRVKSVTEGAGGIGIRTSKRTYRISKGYWSDSRTYATTTEAEQALLTKFGGSLTEAMGGQITNCAYEDWGELTEASEYEGRSVELNKPFRTPGGPKKFAVYVKNEKGNVIKLGFGDPNLSIKRDDSDRRKNFRARHGCDEPGPKWKAKYWSCKFWSKKNVSDLV